MIVRKQDLFKAVLAVILLIPAAGNAGDDQESASFGKARSGVFLGYSGASSETLEAHTGTLGYDARARLTASEDGRTWVNVDERVALEFGGNSQGTLAVGGGVLLRAGVKRAVKPVDNCHLGIGGEVLAEGYSVDGSPKERATVEGRASLPLMCVSSDFMAHFGPTVSGGFKQTGEDRGIGMRVGLNGEVDTRLGALELGFEKPVPYLVSGGRMVDVRAAASFDSPAKKGILKNMYIAAEFAAERDLDNSANDATWAGVRVGSTAF